MCLLVPLWGQAKVPAPGPARVDDSVRLAPVLSTLPSVGRLCHPAGQTQAVKDPFP